MDLTLVSLDDILDEIYKRYDACIFCYVQNLDTKNEASQINFHGGKFTCVGLAEKTKHKLLETMMIEEKLKDNG